MRDLPKPHIMSQAGQNLPNFPWQPYVEDLARIMRLCCEVDQKGPSISASEAVLDELENSPPHWYAGVLQLKGGADFNRQFEHLHDRGLGIQQKILKYSPRNEPCSNPLCSNPAIANSHAIQQERVLRSLADDKGEVVRLYPNSKFALGVEAAKVHISKSSVFPGFCRFCEVDLFREAENTDQPPTRRAVLLLCWRSLLSVYYQKTREAIVKAHAANAIMRNAVAQDELSMALSFLTHMKESLRTSSNIRKRIKLFEADIFHNKRKVCTHRVRMYGIPVVGAGSISLGCLKKRRSIGSYDWRDEYNFGSYNVTSDGRHLYFVAAHANRLSEERSYSELLRSGSDYYIRSSIMTLLSGAGRNAYVSPNYWETCSSKMRATLKELARKENHSPFSLLSSDPPFTIQRL